MSEDEIEYGHATVPADAADEIVKGVVKFRDEQTNIDQAHVTCFDCRKRGWSALCYLDPLTEATPKTWALVTVCRDCADRDDPLCGVQPSELSHPLVDPSKVVNDAQLVEDSRQTELVTDGGVDRLGDEAQQISR